MRNRLAILALAAALNATPAFAAQQRSFVASTGNDAAGCTLIAPCRSFAAAIAQTVASGEVIVLDSAGYGPVTINKSVSIIAPQGVYAGVTVSSGDGVTVDAPGAVITLHGLSISGQGGAIGINVQHAARLYVERCVISNMGLNGIRHTAPSADLSVVDTIVRNAGSTGIRVAADTSVVLDRVRSEHNAFDGFYLVPGAMLAKAVVTDSIFAWNRVNGISVDSVNDGITSIDIERSTLSDNSAAGLSAIAHGGFASVALAHSAIHRNATRGVEVVGNLGQVWATISYNSFVDNTTEILANGLSAHLYVSANTVTGSTLVKFVQANGGDFIVFKNNIGPIISSGTITPGTPL